jgi:FkbM family methyltransferase
MKDLLLREIKKLKYIINDKLGKDLYTYPNYTCETVLLGSAYGGWAIFPDNLNSNSIIYSAGVGKDISFDLGLIEKVSCKIHAFDPTPDSIQWVTEQDLPSNFILHPIGIADFNGEASFASPLNINNVSHRIVTKALINKKADQEYKFFPVKTLSTIMETLGHKKIDILKMDIEGAEYQVIENMLSCNIFPNQLLVEFHHRFKDYGVKKTKECISLLDDYGYKIFSISESNQEYSFIKLKNEKDY